MLLTEDEKKKQSTVALARRYYDGDQAVKLTERQKEWLDQHKGDVKFTVNHCPTVIDAVVERLQVLGFNIEGEPDDASKSDDLLSKAAERWWRENRMDAVQTEAHRKAGIDAEAFILISWDNEEKRPDWVLHPRYIDESAGGDGYGMWVEYPNDDYLQKPKRAVKCWKETDEKGNVIHRRTVYYPDRVERYVQGKSGEWEAFKVEGEEWPIKWVMKDNSPIGIPVAHLKNPRLASDLKEVVPLQDALNKAWLDILAAADTTGFRMGMTFGFVPTKDGKQPNADNSNVLTLAPGQWLSTLKKPSEVEVILIEPANLQPLMDVEDRIVFRIASVSSTPISRFLTTKQVQAEDSQKQGDAPLLGKVQERQTLYGNAWEDMIRISARISNTFGDTAYEPKSNVSTVWKEAAIRDEKAHLEELGMKRDLDVDEETLWTEMGYDQKKIEKFQTRLTKKQGAVVRANAELRKQQQQQESARASPTEGGSTNGQGQQQPAAAA